MTNAPPPAAPGAAAPPKGPKKSLFASVKAHWKGALAITLAAIPVLFLLFSKSAQSGVSSLFGGGTGAGITAGSTTGTSATDTTGAVAGAAAGTVAATVASAVRVFAWAPARMAKAGEKSLEAYGYTRIASKVGTPVPTGVSQNGANPTRVPIPPKGNPIH